MTFTAHSRQCTAKSITGLDLSVSGLQLTVAPGKVTLDGVDYEISAAAQHTFAADGTYSKGCGVYMMSDSSLVFRETLLDGSPLPAALNPVQKLAWFYLTPNQTDLTNEEIHYRQLS